MKFSNLNKNNIEIHFSSFILSGSYYSPHGDGYSKSELTMDSETSLGGLEDVLINQNGGTSAGTNEDTSASIHHSDQSSHNPIFGGPSMTPIDKLYSMQSSYFSAADCECLGTQN